MMNTQVPKPWNKNRLPWERKVVPSPSKARNVPGRYPKIETPEELLTEWDAYVEEVKNNPILEEQLFHSDGKVVRANKEKLRPLTKQGFCAFLGVTTWTFDRWKRDREDLQEACLLIEDEIYEQKYSGAAAGIFHATIVARDLGLAEHTKNQHAVEAAPQKQVPPEHIADIMHPDMTYEQEMALREAGAPIPLYTQALLDLGVPFVMPKLAGHD